MAKSNFSAFGYDMEIISKLDPKPNDSGMSAAQLQAKFDEGGKELKTFLNGTLISQLNGTSGAGRVGITEIPGVTKNDQAVDNIQDALEVIKSQLNSASLNDIPDGAVTTAKLGTGAVLTDKLGAMVVTTEKLYDLCVTAAKLAADAVETLKIKDSAVTTAKLAGAAVTNEKLGAGAVGTENLKDDLVVPVAKGGTGATTSTAALASLGAQKAISKVNVTLLGGSSHWEDGEQTATVTGIATTSEWIAGPASKSDWEKAGEASLYPPEVTAAGQMTFSCDSIPEDDITVTVYFW